MNRSIVFAGLASAAVASPVFGQSMDHSMHAMPGMTMPAQPVAKASPKPAPKHKAPVRSAAPPRAQAAQPPAADPHAGHDMSGMDGRAMDGDQAGAEAGTDLPPGTKPAPAPSGDHLADRFWGADAMASSRETDLRREHGGMSSYQVLFNLAEYQVRNGRDGYRWDGEAWVGGDIDRLWLKSEGNGSFGKPLVSAEVQALYSHALDPYWNLQAGVRYDFKPDPSRTYATIGIEGLASYRFNVEGALFLSDRGEVLRRSRWRAR